MEFTAPTFCIDIGSNNIRMASMRSGTLLTEGAYGVTYTNPQSEVSILALGNTALEMYGRLPKILKHVSLIRDGGIQDEGCLEELLRQLLSQFQDPTIWGQPAAIVCISESITEGEQKQFLQVFKNIGIRKTQFVSRMLAIGKALELPVQDPFVHCVIDIGAHTSEIGILSCGSVIRSKMLKIGGDTFSIGLLRYLRSKYSIEISIKQADRIKERYGSVFQDASQDDGGLVEILGKSVQHHFPELVHLPLQVIRNGLSIGLQMWVSAVEEFMEELPIELSTDIVQNGIFLVGGGALLEGLDWQLSNRLKMMVITPENPHELSVIGAAIED